MILIVIRCSDFGSYSVKNVKASTLLSALMEVGTIPFHVMLV